MPYPKPNPSKNAITKRRDPEGIFVTPIRGGKFPPDWRDGVSVSGPVGQFLASNVDFGYDNLEVRLVEVPDLNSMKRDAALGNVAHVGGNLDPLKVAEMGIEELITFEELANSGLEQTFESQMFSFLVYGCSRGFTHEMVRTRNGASYNQQTFRHTNLTDTRFRAPQDLTKGRNASLLEAWGRAQMVGLATYEKLVDEGVAYEDARTALSMATETYVLVRMPWRTFVDTFAYRACYMFYPEMVHVMHQIYARLEEAHPELTRFLKITCEASKVCTYRGAEPTEYGACPFLWAGRRNWLPDQDKRWPAAVFVHYDSVEEWDKIHPGQLAWIGRGARTAEDVYLRAGGGESGAVAVNSLRVYQDRDPDGLVGTSEWDNRR